MYYQSGENSQQKQTFFQFVVSKVSDIQKQRLKTIYQDLNFGSQQDLVNILASSSGDHIAYSPAFALRQDSESHIPVFSPIPLEESQDIQVLKQELRRVKSDFKKSESLRF